MTRREARELLPWYVAGALSGEELRAVQAFVDTGEITAAELDEIRFIGQALRENGAEEPRYDPQILARVLDRVGHAPQGAPVDSEPLVVIRERDRHGNWSTRLARWLPWSTTPPPARAVIVAQFALLLGLAAPLTLREDVEPAGYPVVSGAVSGDYTLTFAPAVTEAQMRALLLEQRASLVAGPSAIGLYTIAIDPGVDRNLAAEALQASGLVTFIQQTPRP